MAKYSVKLRGAAMLADLSLGVLIIAALMKCFISLNLHANPSLFGKPTAKGDTETLFFVVFFNIHSVVNCEFVLRVKLFVPEKLL